MGNIIGAVGGLIAVIGWFGYGEPITIVIGFVLYLVNMFMERKKLNNNAKVIEISLFVVGCIVGRWIFNDLPWYLCGMLVVNIYGLAIVAVGIIVVLAALIFKR